MDSLDALSGELGISLPEPYAASGPGIRSALEASSGMTARDVSSADALARSLDVSPEVAVKNLEAARREDAARFIARTPMLEKWATDNELNAPFAYEYVNPLSKIFRFTGSGAIKSAAKVVARAPGVVAESGYDLAAMGFSALDMAQEGVADAMRYAGLDVGGRTKWAAASRDYFLGLSRDIRKNYLESDFLSLPKDLRGRLIDNPEYLLDTEWLVSNVGDAATSLAVMLGSAWASGGSRMAAGIAGGAMEAGSFFNDLMKEGVSQEKALSSAVSFGGVTGLLNKIGLDKILTGVGGATLARRVASALAAGGVEGLTEYAEEPVQAVLEGLAKNESPEKILSRFSASFANIDVIPGAFLLGAGVKAASKTRDNGVKAASFADRQKQLHALIAESGMANVSMGRLESAMNYAMQGETASIAASDALTLHQSGVPILERMGWSDTDVEEAARLGQDLTFSLARAHSVLEGKHFDAFIDMARNDPFAMNAGESALVDEIVRSDADSLAERFDSYAAEQNALDAEFDRLRVEIGEALRSVPKTRDALANDATREETALGEDMTPEKAADIYLEPYRRLASLLARHGVSPAERLKNYSFQGLVRGENGRLMTPDEAFAMENARLVREAEGVFLHTLWGRLDAASLKSLGYSAKELQKIHGPGIFAAKGSGVSLDKLAQEMEGYGLLQRDGGADALWERLKQGRRTTGGGTLYQLDDNGNAVAPGEENPGIANVVEVDPAKIVDADGKPVDLKDTRALAGWLREQYQDVTITIADDGTIQKFTGEGLDASLKRRVKKRGSEQRQAYAELDTLLENALFDGFEQADERHKDKVAGQNVYYSAMRIADESGQSRTFSVRFKIDMPLGKGVNPAYKDHKVTEIEIAPSLYRGPSESLATQPESAIRGISLSVLKGDVNPSRMENGVLFQDAFDPNDPRILYQSVFAGSPTRGIRRMSTEYIGTGENTLNEGWGLYSSELKEIADWYRKTLAGGSPHLRRGDLVYRERKGKWGRSDGKSLDDFEEKHLRMLGLVGDRNAIVNAAERRIAAAIDAGRAPGEEDVDIINFFRDTQDGKEGGQIYELDIPDNDVLLKYEDKISEQPEKVREALRHAADSLPGDEVEAAMAEFLNIVLENESSLYTGKQLYNELAKLGTRDFEETATVSTEGKKAASLFLNRIGIPGLRYLSGEDPNAHNFVIFDDKAVNILNTFYQAAESAANEKRAKFESAPTAQFTGKEIFNKNKPFPEKMAERKNAVIAWLKGKGWLNKDFANNDTGWDINVSGNSIRDTAEHGFGEGKAQVLAVLPDLIKNAVYVAPGKKLENGNKRHIFAAKAKIANRDTFVVALVVEENQNGKRFYNHELTEIENLGYQWRLPEGKKPNWASQDSSVLDIVRSHLGVKPSFTLNAGKPDSPRGAISFNPVDDTAVVRLFKGADLSTVLHETGHIFMREMQWLMDQGLADEALQKDYATLLDWVGAKIGEELTVDQQETFARGFEAYLREGRAPAKSLDGAFARFRKWLTKIYRKASSLNVELTDDVRGVFDRMLATEAEVAAAAEEFRLGELSRSEMDAMGLEAKDRAYFTGLAAAVRDAAQARLMEQRERSGKERLRQWFRDAREQANKERVFVAKSAIRAAGLDGDAVRETFGEETAAKLRRMIPGGLRKSGNGIAVPEILAARTGYDSAGEMIADILGSPTLKERVNEIVREKRAEHDARFSADDAVIDTDAAAESLRRLSEVLAEKTGVADDARMEGAESAESANRELARETRKAARAAANEKAVALAVEQRLRGMPMREAVKHSSFAAYAKRAMSASRRAIGKGDFAEALKHNELARINMAMAKRSREIADEAESLRARGKRFASMNKADPDARWMVADIFARHGLDPGNGVMERLAGGKRDGWTAKAWETRAADEGFDVYFGRETASGQTAWNDMTTETFMELSEDVNRIIHVERAMRKISDGAKLLDMEILLEGISGRIRERNKTIPANLLSRNNAAYAALRTGNAWLSKMETLCIKLDGGYNGPLWKALYKRVSDAEDARALRMGEARKAMGALFGIYDARELASIKKQTISVPSLGESISRETMLGIVLNLGNAVNRDRLMSGALPNGKIMSDAALREVLAAMTEKDCRFVQAVWDYLDTFREESFSLEERVNGIMPKRVEPEAFTLRLRDGSTFGFRGGYYPIAYDASKSGAASRAEEQRLQEDLFGTGFGAGATTRQGHLQQRGKAGYGAPLRLDLSVMQNHVFDVVTDITMREAVIDAARLIRSAEVRDAVTAVSGMETYKQFMPWLRSVVRESPPDGCAKISAWMRGSLSMMALGLKVGTGMLQVTGLSAAAGKIGVKWVVRGMRDVYGGTGQASPFHAARNGLEAYRWVTELSPFMANRMSNQIREMRELNNSLLAGEVGKKVNFVRKHAFDLISFTQMATVDLPVWVGAYGKRLSELGAAENPPADITAEAVAYADQAVRLTQGSGKASDMAHVQRDGELWKLTTTFYTWFSAMYNLASLTKSEAGWALEKGRRKKALGIAASFALSTWIGTQAMEIAIDALRGKTPDDDDEWGKYLAGKFLGFWTGMFPGLRNVSMTKHGLRFDFTGADRGIESGVDTANALWNLVMDKGVSPEKKAAVAALRTAGYLTTLPLEGAAQILKGIWDYMDGTKPEIETRKLLLR